MGGKKERVCLLKIDVMGVLFDNVTMDQALDRAEDLIKAKTCAYCVTPNGEIVWEAMHSGAFRQILNDADLVLPDGASVVIGSRILERPLLEKVAGIEFAERLVQRLASRGGRLYLLGGRPGIAERAAENLTVKYPGLQICGTADGYFQDEAAVVTRIGSAAPDVVFVCLGAPKQERFMAAHREQLHAGLLIGLGGSLDGFAGAVKRAPGWMIRCNLEWLYRLLREPSRLGRMMRLPKFMRACKKQRRLEAGRGK